MSNKERVKQFIIENFYVADPSALTDAISLLDQGIIDSTGILELTAFLESTFGIQVADDELVPENLDSIANIDAYLAQKMAQKTSG